MKRALAALVLLGAASAGIWALRQGGPSLSSPGVVTIGPPAAISAPPAIVASPSPRSGLSHARAPTSEALRDAPERQAAYDAEARPGEFVTPPNVSIEH